jgi:hypothetical protein
MPDSTQDIILDELRALRGDFNTFARDTGERVSVLETQVKQGIIGNGQPSRLQRAETAIERIQRWRWQLVGVATGISGLVSAIAWVIVELRK